MHAIGLGAFFLLPFLLEASNVQLQRAGVFDYHNHFLTLAELVSPPVSYDPYYITNAAPRSLPWPQLGLALVASASTLISKRQGNRLISFSIMFHSILLALAIFLTSRLSVAVWDSLSIAYLIQFPWRLLSPATLLLAWLAAAGVACLPIPKFRFSLALLAISSMFFFSLTWTYHDPYRFPDPASPLDVVRFEITDPHSVGTTGSQEFLPKWVNELPAPDTLLQRYSENAIPSRLAPLPSSVKLLEEHAALTATDFRYQSPESFTATFYLFYFPGWKATLDKQPLPIHVSKPNGLITLDLPAGQHQLRLALGPTLPQTIGALISLLALALLFIPWHSAAMAAAVAPKPSVAESSSDTSLISAPSLIWSGLFAAFIALRIAVFDVSETPFRQSEFDEIPNPISINFGDQLDLIGFTYPEGPTLTSGDTLHITLYWRAPQRLTTRYSTKVQLVDAYGNLFGQSDHYSPADVPTPWWPADKYARDEHLIVSEVGTPPGEYHLHVSVYSGGDNTPSTLLNILNGENAEGTDHDLGTVTVTRAKPQAPGPLRLVSASLSADTIQVGGRLAFTLLWNSGDKPLPVLTTHLEFTNADGETIFAGDMPPASPDYTTDQWSPNELVRFPHSLILPPELPAGPVHVTLTLLKPDRTLASEPYDLGQLTIVVPDRSFAVPPIAHPTQYDFNGAIRLLGYELSADSITLYWQSLQPVSTPLTVFIHRFDAEGTFVAGHDSPPSRPITSWLPGEVLTDVHPIAVGDYFDVGLYDPATGDRFGEPFVVRP